MRRATTTFVFRIVIVGVAIAALGAEPAPQPEVASTNTALSPKIQFATPIYDFGRAKVSEPVKYDFVFTNTGRALLEITGVQPGCGCTTAGEWTRKVAPGKTGIIPVQYNAAAAPGPVGKVVNVTCNDKSQPTVVLQIKGVLWQPVEVSRGAMAFDVTPESVASASNVVRIVSNEDAPLTLSPPVSGNGSVAAELKTKQPGKEFELVVKPVPPLQPGNTQGQISVKTSSTNMPVININTLVMMHSTLVAVPPFVKVPRLPVTNNLPVLIYIRVNGPTLVTLSEPAINAKGVEIQMKTNEPGRYFGLALKFAPDFVIGPDEKVELSVKTDFPQIPTFRLPVMQNPRPTR